MRWLLGLATLGALVGAMVSPAAAQSVAPRPYNCDQSKLAGRKFYQCLGAVRGRKGLVRSLTLRKKRYLRDEVRLVARLGFREAIKPLRALLQKPPRVWLKGEVAQALADLKDKPSAGAIRKACRTYERNWSSLHQALRRALFQLDPASAAIYAKGLAKRIKNLRTTWARNMIRAMLPVFLQQQSRAMLPTLRRWTGRRRITLRTLYARLMGARLRLGDKKLLGHYRRYLARSSASVPVNPHHYVDGLGGSTADIPALVRFAGATSPEGRAAYNALDRLIDGFPRLRKAQRRRAEMAIIRGLNRRTRGRENRRSRSFSYSLLARHHAVLARLRLLSSRKRLPKLMTWGPHTATAWVAVERGLAMGLPSARKHLATLAAQSVRFFAPGVLRKYKRRLIKRAAQTLGSKDAGWTPLLLDRNANERTLALYHFARAKPPGACAVVTAALTHASSDAVHDGLVALTVLGKRCRPQLEKLARDTRQRPFVRGTAAEVLAMMRAPTLKSILRRLALVQDRRTKRRLKPYIDRARQIAR
jgi:hypothetical protein